MDEKPKRRWFRFSVRTLLLAITIGCVWFGWQIHRVRQRDAALRYLAEQAAEIRMASDNWAIKPWKNLPVAWEWLGAQPVREIRLTAEFVEDIDTLRDLFPEASIRLPPPNR